MTTPPPETAKRASPRGLARILFDPEAGTPHGPAALGRLPAAGIAGAGVIAVALIALFDLWTDARLSFSIFYLIPVAACAWFGGFSHGILLSLAGAIAWNAVDCLEDPTAPPVYRLWNGVIRFGVLLLASSLVSRLRVSIVRERRLARTDPLTGAANGRTFYETAAAEAERACRAARPLTLAYFDLDDFKQLNDRLGHAVGDEALRCVVQTIQRNLRGPDLLARLGGDEFALLLPDTGARGAAHLLARMQTHLARELARRRWPVTVSGGAVTFRRPVRDVDRMIERVDALMYGAKKQAKGRIRHTVVDDAGAAEEGRWVDRRESARLTCNHRAGVRCEAAEGARHEEAVILDISLGGVGLHLKSRLADNTVLIVEPVAPGVKPLVARVCRTGQAGDMWKHGCELLERLSDEELHAWAEACADAPA